MEPYSKVRILHCGDSALSVEFGNAVDPVLNQRVHRLFKTFRSMKHAGIVDLNPTYRSLLIRYDPWVCSYEKVLQLVDECLDTDLQPEEAAHQLMEIPVCYGGEFGPDLEDVARYHGLSVESAIQIHCAPRYRVYMIGFTPGFPYLGGLDERLFTPRRKEARKLVSAGSVGIADRQTGIYPISSPGGWQIIGRTPLKLFDWKRENPILLSAGDQVIFRPITRGEFESIENS